MTTVLALLIYGAAFATPPTLIAYRKGRTDERHAEAQRRANRRFARIREAERIRDELDVEIDAWVHAATDGRAGRARPVIDLDALEGGAR